MSVYTDRIQNRVVLFDQQHVIVQTRGDAVRPGGARWARRRPCQATRPNTYEPATKFGKFIYENAPFGAFSMILHYEYSK
jgi:hypothetical protein